MCDLFNTEEVVIDSFRKKGCGDQLFSGKMVMSKQPLYVLYLEAVLYGNITNFFLDKN